MQRIRVLTIVGGIVAVIALYLVFRPAGDDDAAPATTELVTTAETPGTTTDVSTTTPEEPATTDETTPEPTTAPPPPPPAVPQPVTVRITVSGGRPVGGIARPSVKKGRQVRIVVRSDVADSVHLHGYDIEREVGPGRPAVIVFRATIPGGFELELEQRGLQIAELEVQP